ncbi:FkbM family methyltransferase [Rhizobium sp. LjRoot254]|uniref:FkbM family methyltransferase n=1 Tax=Rhizobium sp. LjRoot254 TaxID=3342297 RepID=UPI003ED1206F
MIEFRRYGRELREISSQAPAIGPSVLLWRLAQWKILRSLNGHRTVTIHDHSRMRLEARRDDHGIRASIFLFREAYEPSVRFAIDRFVEPGATCYDIGANQGLWSLRMAERAGRAGRVCAFEPIPENVGSLKVNAALSGASIEAYPFALGDSEGLVSMYLPSDVGSGSLARHAEDAKVVDVPIKLLDAFWQSDGCPLVSLVKMDVEGAELSVLRGGQHFISKVKPIVCCEVNPERLRAMDAHVADLLSIFARLSYRSFAWDAERCCLVEHSVDPKLERNVDLVFIPREIAIRASGPDGRLL